jgi:hypothetical protein
MNSYVTRPVREEVVLEESRHYLACREEQMGDAALQTFRTWFLAQANQDEGAPETDARRER